MYCYRLKVLVYCFNVFLFSFINHFLYWFLVIICVDIYADSCTEMFLQYFFENKIELFKFKLVIWAFKKKAHFFGTPCIKLKSSDIPQGGWKFVMVGRIYFTAQEIGKGFASNDRNKKFMNIWTNIFSNFKNIRIPSSLMYNLWEFLQKYPYFFDLSLFFVWFLVEN